MQPDERYDMQHDMQHATQHDSSFCTTAVHNNIYLTYAQYFIDSAKIDELSNHVVCVLPGSCEICNTVSHYAIIDKPTYSMCLLCLFICGEKINKLMPRDVYHRRIYYVISLLSIDHSIDSGHVILQCDICYLYKRDIRTYTQRVCSRCYQLGMMAKCWRYLCMMRSSLPAEVIARIVLLLDDH